jgi:small GTP-binding protein
MPNKALVKLSNVLKKYLIDPFVNMRKALKNRRKKRRLKYIPEEVSKDTVVSPISIKIIEVKKKTRKRDIKTDFDDTFTIIIFGDAGVGISTFLQNHASSVFSNNEKAKTLGINFYSKSVIVDNKRYKLQIWHFKNINRFKLLFRTYAKGARGGIYMYDISNYLSLTHLDNWLKIVKEELKADTNFPVLIVGNKSDLTDNREVSPEVGKTMVRSRGVNGFIECSAQTGENIEKTFESITRMLIKYPSSSKEFPSIAPF